MHVRRVHPKNAAVKQWLLEDDYSRLSVASEKKVTTTAATKIFSKQATALMDAMDIDVDEEFGADVAGDFGDYQCFLEDMCGGWLHLLRAHYCNHSSRCRCYVISFTTRTKQS